DLDLYESRRRRELSLLPTSRHPGDAGLGFPQRPGRQPRGLPAPRKAPGQTRAPMIAIAVGLALVAAAFHGTWNVLVKVSGDPIHTFRRVTLTTAATATIALLPAWWLLGRPAL